MNTQQIIPAIIPFDTADLGEFLIELMMVPEIHIDLCDGEFVAERSGVITNEEIAVVAPLVRLKAIEVDLMVREPFALTESLEAAGADRLVFHIPEVSVEALAAYALTATPSIGVAVLPDTELALLAPYIPHIDFVQVMTIANIGAQGTPFYPDAEKLIRAIHAQYPQLEISIDGGINEATLLTVSTWPVSRLVVGSAIYRSKNRVSAYKKLMHQLSSTG